MVDIRACRCQVTGERGTVSTFYRVSHKGKNKYYKNEEVYRNMIAEKEIKEQLLSYVSINILNYDGSMFLPPVFLKRLNNINKTYPYEVILQTFKDNEDTLLYWMNQDNKFENENNRLNYMMAIIQNKINDTYLKWKNEKKKLEQIEKVELDASHINLAVEVSNQKRVTKKKEDSISDFI